MTGLADVFGRVGLRPVEYTGGTLPAISPIDGTEIGRLHETPVESVQTVVERARQAFIKWREVPAPRRGELVRLWGEELRAAKVDIGYIISVEVGKIIEEGLGEVQEAIDMADLAVGQSRQLFGRTIASERPGHRIMEQYHPLGPVVIITAFNFPVAVFAWNAALALVCGDPVIFKPSDKATLSGLAVFRSLERAMARFGADAPEGLAQIVIGRRDQGVALVESHDVPLVSATGSTAMGRDIGTRVAARFGKRILELGGNNAMIVTPEADLDMAQRAILFGAVGTAGQRCTSLRRLIVHRSVKDQLLESVTAAYKSIKIGNPILPGTLMGPLIDENAFNMLDRAIARATGEGGTVLTGGDRVLTDHLPGGFYVSPCIIDMPRQTSGMREETFAPLLYVLTYDGPVDEAIELQNDVPQGLSSCIFSRNMLEVERFVSVSGSDCGMANVNIGPNGAEIGGAFGGEKETGGDRESGSDAWKQYMRRTTNTINFSTALPLAQGINFGS
ncbi:MAG TPA: aldehyde dehydrogenase family protein [Amaricoccus sp.]|uniref:L-piperidine-6-carboxylate dehydrogenase n=1 Tax=Amaricoccus sp. TaxID=1872485 RepID=UPI002BED349B|nr:aldehyde dehydrogenase family protein [Amaricoccus sp.]HMR31278.1 aldehyde dehydrogenase family protein [Geminicoccus sp.]HMU00275.1 aldehyde dehydrogenase family protein [Amaricoccus sp.]